ncbi:hypothetical protein BDR05DRAFT_949526 [Suillus weaverae]|nr:hypothetical protein BDR05DRAFT_949526 [Suillus weaverae]
MIMLPVHSKMEINQSCIRHSSMIHFLCDCDELETIDDILDVIERFPWDVPLKGVGTQTDLSTRGLQLLLASGPIGGRLVDTMIAAVVERMQASQNGHLQTICVESLILMNTLHLSEKWWANYETEKAFTCLCAISSVLCEGTLQRVLFPINIHNIYWAAIEILLGGIGLLMTLIPFVIGWAITASLNLCGQQLDSFLCGIAAINTIKHTMFCDPLFDYNNAFSLYMEEFLDLAYDHLEPEETLSDAESKHETQPSISTPPSSMQTNKQKLNLHTTDADQNKGLFRFFPKVSHEEHLQHAWKPFTWELKDQERDHYQQEFNKFEKATHKCRRATERKRKSEHVKKLLWSNPQPQAITIAEASCPYCQLQRQAHSKCTCNLGQKLQIECKLKQIDPTRFAGIHAQVIGSWIDHSGTRPAWHANVLACVQKGNLPLTKATPPGILSKYPDVVKTIVEDLHALRTVGVALDTMCCHGVIIACLTVSCPEVFKAVVKDGSRFQCTESWKTPSNANQLCLDQFLHLTLTIRNCAVFHACFYVNIDQTNIMYQPANTATYEEVSSKQVAVIGHEEKQAFTVVVSISASSNALPFQVIYCGKTACSLPTKNMPQFKEAGRLGFKLCFSNTNTYWSTFELMCDYTRQKELIGAPDDQECILHLDVWSVHKSIQFCTWLDQHYPWIKYHFVPGGCTGIAQPCNVGVQHPFKLAVKQSQHADIVDKSLSLLKKNDAAAAIIQLDTTLPTLCDRSLHWLINGYHAINKPNIVRQSLTSREALQVLHDVEKNDVETWDRIKTAQYKVEKPQSKLALDGVEPPFANAADVKFDPCDILADVVLLHITSGGSLP